MTVLEAQQRQFSQLRVALVHHWFIQRGGAERVVEAIGELFPNADLFALMANRSAIAGGLEKKRLRTSYLQKLPAGRRYHRLLLPLYPTALESLDLSEYDLVVSSESGPSKGVLTTATTLHVCYCHSPMRYLWEMPHSYLKTVPGGCIGRGAFRLASHYVRNWDYATAARVDHFIASSQNAARRIRKHYRRDAAVVYPPVDTKRFAVSARPPGDYYLVVGRMVAYKRIDLAIAACTKLGRRLLVVGRGEEERVLRKLAGPGVEFVTRANDAQVLDYYQHCRGFLFPGEEDIGLTPIEAQACGRPVVAYARGGALETVVPLNSTTHAPTGVFFEDQTVDDLTAAIQQLESHHEAFEPQRIRMHARQFDRDHFFSGLGSAIAERLELPRAAKAGR